MDRRGAHTIARLTKRDVEDLLDGYDADPVGALTAALAKVLERPGAAWPDLVAATPLPDATRSALRRGDTAALDSLVALLNEARQL